MFPLSRARWARCVIPLVIGVSLVAVSQGIAADSDVADVSVTKGITFIQISPSDVYLERNGYALLAVVDAARRGSVLDARFGPVGGGLFSLTQQDPFTFSFVQTFDDPTLGGAIFPNGDYHFDLTTATPPTQLSYRITLAPRYPDVVPQLSNAQWYSVLLQFDATQPIKLNWNDFPNFQTDPVHPSSVELQVMDIFRNIIYDQTFDTPVTSATLPANLLAADNFYVGRLLFINADQATATPQTGSLAFFMTEFIISAVNGPPVIFSPTDVTANAGQLFVYVTQATNAPGTFSATNIPPGTFAFNDGVIGGYPTAPGIYDVQLSATNSIGTGTSALRVNVVPSGQLAITSSTRAAGSVGDPFRFQVLAPGASNNARLSTTNLPPGLTSDPVTGLISGTPQSDGEFAVQLTITDGGQTAQGLLLLTFDADPAFPGIRSPTSVTLVPGQTFSYKIDAIPDSSSTDDPKYQLVGQLPTGLSFDSKTGTISGTYNGNPARDGSSAKTPLSGGALIGNVQLFASNSRGTATVPLCFFNTPVGAVNISTRMKVGTGDNALIGGFIVTGNAPKKLIVRGMGPSLNIEGALQDPVLEIHSSDGSLLAMNDDWRTDHEQDIRDTGVPPSDDREAAVVAAFPPGGYTAIVRGKNGATGTGLVELYDLGTAALDASSDAKLANISTRGPVQTGDDVMIGGFIVQQNSARVIARALGPELTQSGVAGALTDPTLELRGPDGEVISFNDNWRDSQEQDIIATQVPPQDDRESAIVATLAPGAYTAVVRGNNNTTGVALVEIYALQ